MPFEDPIYGQSPVDLGGRWFQTMRPPLVLDAETRAWQATVVGVFEPIADSSWHVRWRTNSVTTALGVHLGALGRFYLLRPDGWDDDRYRSAVMGIDGVAGAFRTPDRTAALADGLEQPGQAWEVSQADPASYIIIFYGISDDEAQTYRTVLEWGRPKGVQLLLVYSNVAKADTFVLDVSLLDGPDVLAKIL